MWKQWVNVVLGLLVIVFVYTGPHVIRFAIAGVLILVLSLWAALEKKKV